MKITMDEAKAILSIKSGADVYDYGLAGTLRGLERRGLAGLIDITKPQMATGNGAGREPYFGAIATHVGLRLAASTMKPKPAKKSKAA